MGSSSNPGVWIIDLMYHIPKLPLVGESAVFLPPHLFRNRRSCSSPHWPHPFVSYKDDEIHVDSWKSPFPSSWVRRIIWPNCCEKVAKIYVPWSKVAILGMVIPPFNRSPSNGYINPYYWVDDHPLLYGNNGSLDPGTYGLGTTNYWIIPEAECFGRFGGKHSLAIQHHLGWSRLRSL